MVPRSKINVHAVAARKSRRSRRAAAASPLHAEKANLSPAPETPVAPRTLPKGKTGLLVDLLSRPGGADIATMMAATEWQAHSVRGALSGAIKKKLGLIVISEKIDGGRVYRLVTPDQGLAA